MMMCVSFESNFMLFKMTLIPKFTIRYKVIISVLQLQLVSDCRDRISKQSIYLVKDTIDKSQFLLKFEIGRPRSPEAGCLNFYITIYA